MAEYWHVLVSRHNVNDELARWTEDGWLVKKFARHPDGIHFDILFERGAR
jgi:hypothetical protein